MSAIYLVCLTPENADRIAADAAAGLYASFFLNLSTSLLRPLLECLTATCSTSQATTQRVAWVIDGDLWGSNPDFLVEMKDNSIGEENRRSQPDYNRCGMLRLSDRYTNSHGRRDLVEHENPAMRALVLQAIEELARTSRTSTELRDEYEVS
jgi:hypothetical protein